MSDSGTDGSPRPTRGPARELAILAAAVELVAEVGYDRVTLDAIAARARASKATMYRKWPNKAELVADALRRRAEGNATEPPNTGSLRGDLLQTVSAIARTFSVQDGGPSLLVLAEAIRLDAPLRATVRAQIEERSRQEGLLICEQATARGEAVDSRRGPAVVGLAMAHLFLRTLLDGEPPNPHDQQALVDDLLLPLLTSPEGRPA